MVAITAVVDAVRAVVRVEVDWTSINGVRYAGARRVLADGTSVPVRLSYHVAHPSGPWALLSGGRAIFHDTEAPLDTPITYRTDSPQTASGVTSTAPVTVPGGAVVWLKDPLRPGNNLRVVLRPAGSRCAPGDGVVFLGLADETLAADGGVFDLVESARPTTTTGIRKDATSTLTLLTATLADRDRVAALLAPGSPVLVQAPAVYGWPDRYLAAAEVRVARISRDHRLAWRRITVPFTVVDPPAGFAQGVPGGRWVDLCDRFATWDQLTTAAKMWADLVRGG